MNRLRTKETEISVKKTKWYWQWEVGVREWGGGRWRDNSKTQLKIVLLQSIPLNQQTKQAVTVMISTAIESKTTLFKDQ